jgi:hypothetical protein
MTTRTAAELATAVMRRMGLISASEDPSAEDSDYLTTLYEEKLAELAALYVGAECIYWASSETPLAVFNVMVDLVANAAGPAFGRGASYEELAAREAMILKRLFAHVARPTMGLPVRGIYY